MPVQDGETLVYDQGTTMWINAWGVEYDNPRLVYKMYTDFFQAGNEVNDPWLGATVINGTCSSRDSLAHHPGIIRLNSSGNISSGYRFMTAVNSILFGGAEHAEFVFKTETNLNDVRVRLGYQDSLNDTAPTDGAWIDMNDGTLTGKTRNAGTESTTGTNYTLAASTWYRAKIAVYKDVDLITFFLYSAAGALLWTDTLAANIPTAVTGHGVVAWIDAARGQILIELDMMYGSRAGYITR